MRRQQIVYMTRSDLERMARFRWKPLIISAGLGFLAALIVAVTT